MASNSSLYDTNLNSPPYFDDFDQSAQYYKLLFKPATAVQARELNQIQTTLQDQIDKFGRNIYKEGSIVEGCVFTYDTTRRYVKLTDSYVSGNTGSVIVSNLLDYYVLNTTTGLKAQVIDTLAGTLSQAPNTNTLYVKYLNSGVYPNTSQQTVFDADDQLTVLHPTTNVSIGVIQVASNTTNANVGVPTGVGYAVSITEGVCFKKGTFIYVNPQTVLVTAYANTPDDLSVGFNADESIVTALANSHLYDNALGSSNFNAPGSDRFKLTPNLIVRTTSEISNTESFFSLINFKLGAAVTAKQTAEYSSLGVELAKRTYETNGDFVVSPFILTSKNQANTANNDHFNLLISRGTGYVKGYNVEYLNNNVVEARRGLDYNSANQQIITTSFGNYIDCNEVSGSFGSNTVAVQVELHNVAKTSITSGTLLSTSYSSSTKIGTAYMRGVQLSSGIPGQSATQYTFYLFNIVMNAGQNFSSVKSIIYYDGSLKGVADTVLTYSATLSANIAVLQQPYLNGMIFSFGQRALKQDGFNNLEYTYRRKGSFQMQSNGSMTVSIPNPGSGTEYFPYSSGYLSFNEIEQFHFVPTQQGATANLTGNVSVSNSNANVTGSSTTFLTNYVPGDYIGVDGANRQITFVGNNTFLQVESAFPATNTNSTHQKVFPIGSPIPFRNRNGRTISVPNSTSNSITVSIGDNPASAFYVDVFHNVRRLQDGPIAKILNKNIFVGIDCSTHPNGVKGPWSLGLPDVYKIEGVYVGGTYSNTLTNQANSFVLDTGQRDTHYDLSSLTPNGPVTGLSTSSKVLVQLSCFTYDTSVGVGFFSGNSYPVSTLGSNTTITLQEIPLYTTSKGTVFDLRDSIDFRPYATNTAVVANSIVSKTENPSSTISFTTDLYMPAPDSEFQTDLEYYLKRIDRVCLDIGGNPVVIEGVPDATRPLAPAEPTNAMTLGLLNVTPYPTLVTEDARTYNRYDYAVTTTLLQNKRYTMRDIGVLDSRIKNLEYYTSLSLLEQAASNLLVRSSTTGQNRFQNGIFVDPFNGFDLSNTNDPQFFIAIDSNRSELRPSFGQFRSTFSFDSTRSAPNVVQHGSLIMLAHTSNNVYINQPYASRYRNCIEGNVYQWNGVIELDPPGTITPDLSASPDVTNNLDLASNWINLRNAVGTQWGNWVDTTSTSTPTLFNASSSSTVTNPDGSQNITTTTQTLNNVTTSQTQTGVVLNTTPVATNNLNLGNFVTNIGIMPYLKAAVIKFHATGMKPNTRLYAYFGNVPVSSYCAPTRNDYTGTGIKGDTYSNIYGDPIYTDASGSCWGYFFMPANTFKAQENDFVLNDISDLVQGASAIQTQASKTFYGSNLTFAKGQSILSTQSTVLSSTEVSQTRQISGLQLSQTQTVQYIPPPQPSYGGGGGCGCGGSCFTKETLIELENGTLIPIMEIKVGDRVYNYDKSSINTVKYIEKVIDSKVGKLYSPVSTHKPFATINHPIYVNNELQSFDPEMNYEMYPWLGKMKKINIDTLEIPRNEYVYNLWVDGDGTYTVNGFGTHSIIGDGGALRLAIEYGYITEKQALDLLYKYSLCGKNTAYTAYFLNKIIGKYFNSKAIIKLYAKLNTSNGKLNKFMDLQYNLIGKIAELIKVI